MSKPLEEVKRLTVGQLAALVHAIGGLGVVKAILRDKDLARRVAEFIGEAMREGREVVEEFFTVIADKDAPAHLADSVAKWRKFASDLCYGGPVLWAVKAGFTLNKHVPFVGRVYEELASLDWGFKNAERTVDCLVFFIPRIIATKKKAVEQMQTLAKFCKDYDLPANHCCSFGSAALVSGLILAHFRCTGERIASLGEWVNTDTFPARGGNRIKLGNFNEEGLRCDYWTGVESTSPSPYLGVFPLGVEAIES